MTVDLARVLELHDEATRRRELTMCSVANPLVDCVLAADHSGPHFPREDAAIPATTVLLQLARDERDRYAAVVEHVPAMVEELEEARRELASLRGIHSKVNEALNRAGCYSALYFWEHIDNIAKERTRLQDALIAWRTWSDEVAPPWGSREERTDEKQRAKISVALAEAKR